VVETDQETDLIRSGCSDPGIALYEATQPAENRGYWRRTVRYMGINEVSH